jgi:hypothetical protein
MFALKKSLLRVSQRPLEAYMVVNFRVREISRGMHKLTRTPILIIIKKKSEMRDLLIFFIFDLIFKLNYKKSV